MRKNVITKILTVFLFCFSIACFGQDKTKEHLKYSGGIITGYNRGYGIQTNLTVLNFAKELPFKLRFGLGYTFINPGNAADVRRIFINNATNGVPEKKGGSFDFRIDFLLHKQVLGINSSYLVFGPRFSTYLGNFKYVGGNEDFDITSHQWGFGGGIENQFKLTQKLNLVIGYGIDYYFPGKLTGHDTSYSPNNDNVNANEDNQNNDILFRYKDANRAVKQPVFMPHIMLGVNFNL